MINYSSNRLFFTLDVIELKHVIIKQVKLIVTQAKSYAILTIKEIFKLSSSLKYNYHF